MSQLRFNGKKTKPAKLRRDYWRPMALVQFPKGAAVIGRSVFQKLREFRTEHELSWGHQANEFYGMNRQDRGKALNDQKANSIADLAAALGGAGRGNRIWVTDKETALREAMAGVDEPPKKLAGATVYWANETDRLYANSWSENVTHELGLPTEGRRKGQAKAEVPEDASFQEVEAAQQAERAAATPS